MSTKVFNTRLQLKYDSWKNWYDNNPTLLAGEIAIVNVPAQTDESTGEVTQKPAILFKVGDGTTDFRTLDWASGLAADVYGWAKAENKPEYIASEITVSDESGYFGNNSVEGVLKEIWETVAEMTGGSGSTGSIASQIANGIAALGSASVSADGKYVTGVKVVDGKLVIEEKDLPDYSNTYAAKDLEQTVADHITAVAEYDSRITAAQSQADKGVTDAAAAKSAADAAQATANKAYVLPEGGIEEDLSDAVKASLAKANSAIQDVSTLATKDELGDVSDRVEAIENDHLKAADKTELEGKITTAQETATAAKNRIDTFLDTEGVADTVDSLHDIKTWMEGDGVDATELTEAIAKETKAREDADAGFETRVKALEEAAPTHATKNEVATAKQEAIDAAAADATTKANTAETNSKAYTDEEIGKLHTVAKSGKIEDLEQEAEYVIFNCGTASTLISEPITE